MAKRGPGTENGRDAVRYNAWKHGISSEAMALPEFEDADEWEAYRDGVFESLEPEGHLECALAERIAIALWKMRRLDFYHMTMTVANMSRAVNDLQVARAYRDGKLAARDFEDISEDDAKWARLQRTFPDDGKMAFILRYEAHYHRQYMQTMHELEAMQERRKGNATPLARVDFSGSPAN